MCKSEKPICYAACHLLVILLCTLVLPRIAYGQFSFGVGLDAAQFSFLNTEIPEVLDLNPAEFNPGEDDLEDSNSEQYVQNLFLGSGISLRVDYQFAGGGALQPLLGASMSGFDVPGPYGGSYAVANLHFGIRAPISPRSPLAVAFSAGPSFVLRNDAMSNPRIFDWHYRPGFNRIPEINARPVAHTELAVSYLIKNLRLAVFGGAYVQRVTYGIARFKGIWLLTSSGIRVSYEL